METASTFNPRERTCFLRAGDAGKLQWASAAFSKNVEPGTIKEVSISLTMRQFSRFSGLPRSKGTPIQYVIAIT